MLLFDCMQKVYRMSEDIESERSDRMISGRVKISKSGFWVISLLAMRRMLKRRWHLLGR